MRTYKLVLYILFAALSLGVMGLLSVWTFTERPFFLYLSGGLAAVFVVFFIGILILNHKTGWHDEKTVRGRILGDAPLLLELYFAEQKTGKAPRLVAAAYDCSDAELFLEIMKKQGENADMGIFDDAYIGYITAKPALFSAARKKKVVLAEETYAALKETAELKEFLEKNTFLFL